MAKGARASTKKQNNSKLKSRVFGPVETARTERLSAKLIELASQPRPKKIEDEVMAAEGGISEENNVVPAPESKEADSKEAFVRPMEVDQGTKGRTSLSKGRIEKKRASNRKASIVFPKYKAGKRIGGKAKKQKIY